MRTLQKDLCGGDNVEEGEEWNEQETGERDVVCFLVLLPASKVRGGDAAAEEASKMIVGR